MFRRHKIRGESHVRQRQVGGLEPTVEREHVCGPDVISTATVKGAREISAGRSPLAQQVARYNGNNSFSSRTRLAERDCSLTTGSVR